MIKEKYSKFTLEELEVLEYCIKQPRDYIKVPGWRSKFVSIYLRLLDEANKKFQE